MGYILNREDKFIDITKTAKNDNSVIELEGIKGFQVEEGIYFFPSSKTVSRPRVSLIDNSFYNELAVVGMTSGFHPYLSISIYVNYAAIDKKYFSRLYELMILNGPQSGLIYSEIGSKKTGYTNGVIENQKYSYNPNLKDLPIPEDAEEIVEGMGIENIRLRISRPFLMDSDFKSYKAAYILENELVLLSEENNQLIVKRHRLDYLSGLYVEENKKLKCGIDYPYIHEVINSEKDKIKEVMNKSSYENYIYEFYQDKITELILEIKDYDIAILCDLMDFVGKSESKMKIIYDYLKNNSDITSLDIMKNITEQSDIFENKFEE